jgi:hypothetical protein
MYILLVLGPAERTDLYVRTAFFVVWALVYCTYARQTLLFLFLFFIVWARVSRRSNVRYTTLIFIASGLVEAG